MFGLLDGRVGALLNSRIFCDWQYLWIDAACVKVRETGRFCWVRPYCVPLAVSTCGQRELLGLAVGASEAELF